MSRSYESPGPVVRAALAMATVGFGLLGFMVGEGKLLVAAGAFGILWTVWDLLWAHLLAPFGDWALRLFSEGAGGPPANTRPTLDDTIRLLESHLEHGASRHVEIQSAIRLAEIYETVRKDPAKAEAVKRRITAKYPDARELERWRD